MSYEEEDFVSYEEEDAFVSYEEEDTCANAYAMTCICVNNDSCK